eukprot:scaffold62127_cov60-Phaeocystis_antarctica.AAC.1
MAAAPLPQPQHAVRTARSNERPAPRCGGAAPRSSHTRSSHAALHASSCHASSCHARRCHARRCHPRRCHARLEGDGEHGSGVGEHGHAGESAARRLKSERGGGGVRVLLVVRTGRRPWSRARVSQGAAHRPRPQLCCAVSRAARKELGPLHAPAQLHAAHRG